LVLNFSFQQPMKASATAMAVSAYASTVRAGDRFHWSAALLTTLIQCPDGVPDSPGLSAQK
jgi:hypothetical protein